ncbi:polyketide synthase, partial [Streptomyces bambusae]|nr:polyketide synthase [Streptomyces bambusae]
ESIDAAGSTAVTQGTLRRDEGGPQRLLASLAEAWTHGAPVDWQAVGETPDAPVELPTYAFQRRTYWLEGTGGGRIPAVVDEAEAAFWESVERADADALAGTLELADAQPLHDLLPALTAWRRRRREANALDARRYRVVWKHRPDGPAASLAGTWLLLTPGAPGDERVEEALTAHGARTHRVALDPAAADRAAWAQLLRAA